MKLILKQKERLRLWAPRILVACAHTGQENERCSGFILVPFTCRPFHSRKSRDALCNTAAASHISRLNLLFN